MIIRCIFRPSFFAQLLAKLWRQACVDLTGDFCMPFPSRCFRKLAGLPDHLVRLKEERRRNR
jgi:hypothetical protein